MVGASRSVFHLNKHVATVVRLRAGQDFCAPRLSAAPRLGSTRTARPLVGGALDQLLKRPEALFHLCRHRRGALSAACGQASRRWSRHGGV